MRTAVIILNWNTADYLRSFLPAVIRSCSAAGTGRDGEPEAGVIVADSGSTDGTDAMMAAEFPSVRFLPLGANYGFTGGYNRAIAQILDEADAPEYIVLMNSDIDVAEGWIEPLTAWMDAHPGCGACGPKLHALMKTGSGFRRSDRFEYAGAAGGYVDRFGYPWCRGRVLSRTDEDRGQYDVPKDVLWVSGACLMTRASLWKELGGLDSRFFAHMEEIDYCWRLALGGYAVTVVPQSVAWHLGGGTLPQDSPRKLHLNYRNNLMLLDNNLARTFMARGIREARARRKAARVLFMRMVLDGASAMVYLLSGRKECFRAVLEAHREFRGLRGRPSPEAEEVQMATPRPGKVGGYGNNCIILQSLLYGGRVFGHLNRKYEDSH